MIAVSTRHALLIPFSAWLALTWMGCERSGPQPGDAPAPAAPRAEPVSGEPDLPPPGGAFVQSTAAGYTLLVNQATRREVLERLARVARFHVEFGSGAAPDARLTLGVRDAELDAVLAETLRGVPYAVYTEIAADGSLDARWLQVGSLAAAASSPAASRDADARPRPSGDPVRRAMLAEMRRERDALEAERRKLESEKRFVQLEHPDPELRADAATWISADTYRGMEALSELLLHDPSPQVRAEAAQTLGEANDELTALGALLVALEDPDPRVVIEALDAIEFVGDETTIPVLAPLLKHRDPDVRARTIEAIEFLE